MADVFRNFKSMGKAIVKDLKAFEKQHRFASVIAMTRTAQAVKAAERKEMAKAFDRPTRYTLNALYMRRATKAVPEARVGFMDFPGKGTPAWRYLGPEIEGGARRYKRFERSLAAAGLLPHGLYAVPGDGADLDAYGNMSRGQIVKILSALRASADPLQNASKADKSRRRRRKENYFVGGIGRAAPLPPGIYKRIGSGPAIPVVAFVAAPHYRKRFDFFGVADRTVKSRLDIEFAHAFEQASRTAR